MLYGLFYFCSTMEEKGDKRALRVVIDEGAEMMATSDDDGLGAGGRSRVVEIGARTLLISSRVTTWSVG